MSGLCWQEHRWLRYLMVWVPIGAPGTAKHAPGGSQVTPNDQQPHGSAISSLA